MSSTVTVMAIRQSARLSKKLPVGYRESDIPFNNTRKNLVQKPQPVKAKIKKMITPKKIKKEINDEPSTVILDMSRQVNLENAVKHMKKYDTKLATYLDEQTIKEFQKRMSDENKTDPFISLTRSIIYQQIHGKAAASIYGRFLQLFETVPPSPADVLEKTAEELKSAGLSTRKVMYIQSLASHFKDGLITPEKFNEMSDKEISAQLCAVKGIGQWTVDMFLIFDLHHSDVLPIGDLAIRKGVANHFGLALPSDKKKAFPSPDKMIELTQPWRPYRSLATWLIWRISNTVVTGDEK